jgi:hypothetical protein
MRKVVWNCEAIAERSQTRKDASEVNASMSSESFLLCFYSALSASPHLINFLRHSAKLGSRINICKQWAERAPSALSFLDSDRDPFLTVFIAPIYSSKKQWAK